MSIMVYFYPIALFFMSWGVGSFIRTINMIRGRNKKRTFWLFSILYAIFMILILAIEWISPPNTFGNVLNGLFIGMAIFGVLSPLLNLGVKWSFPDVISKTSSSQTNANQKFEGSVEREFSLKELQPVFQDNRSDIKTNLYYPFDSAKSRTYTNVISGQIFISYRRSDSADIAGRIYDRLVDRFGKEPVFKDVDSIPLGYDFKEYIDRMVGESDVLLAIIGDRWLDARDKSGEKRIDDPLDFVRIEIESVLARDIPVIPLLVRGAKIPNEESLPPSLRKLVYRNGIPIRPDPDFHRDMDRLISALEKYFSKHEK